MKQSTMHDSRPRSDLQQTYFEFAIEYRAPIDADSNDLKIAKGQVALLQALLMANGRNGTLDDATAKLSEPFEDSGKWRGQIPLGLSREGLIEQVGAANSRRRSRHRGLLRRWRLVDALEAYKRIDSLMRVIQRLENAHPKSDSKGGAN